MSKRKREGEDKLEPDAVDKLEGGGALNTSSSLSAATPSGQAELQTNGSHGTCSPGGAESTPASVDLSKAADLASKAMPSTGGKDGPVKITICGEEVTLKGTAGRRKRKQPVETLILLAYKGHLAMACKNNNMVAALDLYREMKSKEIKQDPSIHQMVLAVCGGSPGERDELDPGNGAVGSYPKSGRESISIDPLAAAAATAAASGCNSAEENTSAAAEAALQILSDVVKDGKTSLPESAYTGVIRACCLDGRADKARQVLESLKRAGGKPRLRTYSPLLEAYSRLDGRLQDCMEIWRDGVSPDQGLTMTEREYLHLITACTRARHEKCFLEVMAEYMEDVLQPRSRRSWEVLKEWFRVAGESKITNPSITTTSTSSPPKDALENSSDAVETDVDVKVHVDETRAAAGNSNGALEEAPSDPPRPPPAVEAADHAWKVSECRVGNDGSCGKCEEVLVSIELSEDDERRLLKQIEVLVCTNEERTRQWEGYRGWLERRGRDRYNVIIDGANLGYYKQNAAAAGELADLRQVDWAVKKYEGEGKKPLVVLHSRHLVEKRLSDEAKEILKRWREAEVIQSCAPKNNDDWYWLYAAVYAGGRVLVLTNDEMRDHHFSMLSHRSFQRWKERHQARFSFGDWDDDMREVVVEEPASYSKRTQKGRGGDSWHVPLEGSDDWLCITRRKEE